jgi:hypothetical protein
LPVPTEKELDLPVSKNQGRPSKTAPFQNNTANNFPLSLTPSFVALSHSSQLNSVMSSTQQPTSKKRSLESTSSDSILSIALASKTPKFDLGAYLDENKYKGITPTFARFVLEERFRKSLVAGNSGADYSCLPMHIILYILEFHRLEIDEINGKVKHRLIGRHRNDNTRHMVLVFTNLAFTG